MKKQANKKKVTVHTKYGAHVIVLERDGKGYMATAPGLQGVITWGKTVTHAKEMAKEAIELCIECLAEENLKEVKRIPAKKLAREFVTAGV